MTSLSGSSIFGSSPGFCWPQSYPQRPGLFLIYLDGLIFVPRSVGAIYGGFAFLLLFMGRLHAMSVLISSRPPRHQQQVLSAACGHLQPIRPARIWPIRSSPAVDIASALFIDDDPHMWGRTPQPGSRSAPGDLPSLIARNGLQDVFLALPEASRTVRIGAVQTI